MGPKDVEASLADLQARILKLQTDSHWKPGTWRTFWWWFGAAALLAAAGLWLRWFLKLRLHRLNGGEEPPFRWSEFFQRDIVGIFSPSRP